MAKGKPPPKREYSDGARCVPSACVSSCSARRTLHRPHRKIRLLRYNRRHPVRRFDHSGWWKKTHRRQLARSLPSPKSAPSTDQRIVTSSRRLIRAVYSTYRHKKRNLRCDPFSFFTVASPRTVPLPAPSTGDHGRMLVARKLLLPRGARGRNGEVELNCIRREISRRCSSATAGNYAGRQPYIDPGRDLSLPAIRTSSSCDFSDWMSLSCCWSC